MEKTNKFMGALKTAFLERQIMSVDDAVGKGIARKVSDGDYIITIALDPALLNGEEALEEISQVERYKRDWQRMPDNSERLSGFIRIPSVGETEISFVMMEKFLGELITTEKV